MDKKYNHAEIKEGDVTKYVYEGEEAVEFLVTDGLQQSLYEIQHGVLPDFRTNIPCLREMKSRESDIHICAYPKAGTHWTWEITQMLIKGNTTYEKKSKENYGLEFHEPHEFDNLPSPRVFNSHIGYRHLPRDVVDMRCKIIFIQRNPKDVAVSFFNHTKKLDPLFFDGSWENYLKLFLDEKVYYQGWFTYTNEWEKAIQNNKDYPILSLYFEDMKKDPIAEIKKIAEFLGFNYDTSFIKEVAEKCNFKNMKNANKDTKHTFGGTTVDIGQIMFRKGQTGDWKNWFTVAQNEQFDHVYQQRMRESNFVYSFT